VGQVDDPHDAEDQRHAQGNQGIETAQEHPGCNRLNENHKIHNLTPADFIVPTRVFNRAHSIPKGKTMTSLWKNDVNFG